MVGHPVWEALVSPSGTVRGGLGREMPMSVDYEPQAGCLHCRLD